MITAREPRTMRCISLWQPWASLVVFGYKIVETRHWSTDYTGYLAIHAAQKKSGKIHMECVDNFAIVDTLHRMGHDYHSLPRGGIVGYVYLGACYPNYHPVIQRLLKENVRVQR